MILILRYFHYYYSFTHTNSSDSLFTHLNSNRSCQRGLSVSFNNIKGMLQADRNWLVRKLIENSSATEDNENMPSFDTLRKSREFTFKLWPNVNLPDDPDDPDDEESQQDIEQVNESDRLSMLLDY